MLRELNKDKFGCLSHKTITQHSPYLGGSHLFSKVIFSDKVHRVNWVH